MNVEKLILSLVDDSDKEQWKQMTVVERSEILTILDKFGKAYSKQNEIKEKIDA